MNLMTIQKLATDKGIHQDSIKKMITDKKLTAYKQDGFKRIMVDLDQFNTSFKPINETFDGFDLDIFNI